MADRNVRPPLELVPAEPDQVIKGSVVNKSPPSSAFPSNPDPDRDHDRDLSPIFRLPEKFPYTRQPPNRNIPDSRPRRASPFALLCALLWLIFSLLCALCVLCGLFPFPSVPIREIRGFLSPHFSLRLLRFLWLIPLLLPNS